jgi:hypothetical protein
VNDVQLTDVFMKVRCYCGMKVDCNLRCVACFEGGGGNEVGERERMVYRGGWPQKICLFCLVFVVSIGYDMAGAGHSIHVACTVSTNGKRADVLPLVGVLLCKRQTGSFHELSSLWNVM